MKTFTYSTFTTANNALIFGGNSGGSIVKKSWKVYSCRLYDNGNLIVPCYRISDGEPGLYDMVNNQFYTDAANSSTRFVLGSSV